MLLLVGPGEIATPPYGLARGYFTKCLRYEGVPILGSDLVEDRALFRARELIAGMLREVPDAWRRRLGRSGVTFSVIAEEERTTDLPQYRYLKADHKTDWDARARGFGGRESSAGEENLLESTTDRYRGASILVHEFAHTLDSELFSVMDPRFRRDLKATYAAAVREGLWRDTYTGSNATEYWAGGVQCYFDCNYFADPPNGIHNAVSNRWGLARYDPRLFRLIDRAFDRNGWRYPGRYNETNRRYALPRG